MNERSPGRASSTAVPTRRRRTARFTLAGLLAAIAMAFAAPVASAAPWQCDSFGYLFQAPTNTPPGLVQQIDLVDGGYSTIDTTTDVLNAVGYNVLDNYFYAWSYTQARMVRVEADGSLVVVPSDTFTGSLVGDVDSAGQYYALGGPGTTTIYRIDYAPGSPTYGRIIRTVTIGALPAPITYPGADWAYIGGYLYMIGSDDARRGHLLRIDPNTGARVDLTPAGFGANIDRVGAVYADSNGYLYGSNNEDGNIWRVDPRTGQAILVSTATAASTNDGARCASAPIPTVTVKKVVDGRVRPADQFTVGLTNPSATQVTAASTTGTDSAVSTVDWPVTQNATYTITDAMTAASTTPIGEYAQSIACVDEFGAPVATGGSAGRWTLLIATPTDYVCTITNRARADLAVTKSVSSSPIVPGTNVTYTLTATNNGPSLAAEATVSDTLPAGLTFVSASAGCVFAGGTVTCSAGDLAAGAVRTFTITASVAPDLAAGTMTNTATGTSRTPDPDPGNNTPETRTPIDPTADLSIVKRALSDKPVPGRSLTYELVVFNDGPSVARDVRVTDPLPRELSFVSASDGCTFASGTVTCTAASLAPGRSLTYTVVARVPSSFTGQVSNTATVTSSTRDPDPTNNEDRETVPSGPQADLSITKTPSVDTIGVGGQLFYTLAIRNDGPSDARGVVVTDVAGAGLTLLSAESSQGSCTVTAGSASCRLGTLAAGGTAQVLVSARADLAGALSNRATVDSSTDDPDPSNNRDQRTVTGTSDPLPQPADLEIVKSSNRRATLGAQSITYTLRVTNKGPGAATGVQVLDTPSLPVKVVSVRTTVGRCATSVPIRCDLGTLAAGARATITVVAQPQAPGTLRNSASVTGDVPDPDAGNNIDGTSTKVQGLLKIRKTASRKVVRAGGMLSYRITVTNASSFALRSVRVCDALPSGLAFVSATPQARLSKGKHCWTVKTLGANKSRSFTIKARALRGASGRKVNVATATAPGARGARTSAATGTAAIRVLPAAARGGGVTG